MKILILNGVNLNMLGVREPEIYGACTLADIELACRKAGGTAEIDFRQTNNECEMVELIQRARARFDAIIINAAAWTHTSIAIHDALKTFDGRVIEVHLSDPKKREAFRHISYIEPVAQKTFAGRGVESYTDAIKYIIQK